MKIVCLFEYLKTFVFSSPSSHLSAQSQHLQCFEHLFGFILCSTQAELVGIGTGDVWIVRPTERLNLSLITFNYNALRYLVPRDRRGYSTLDLGVRRRHTYIKYQASVHALLQLNLTILNLQAWIPQQEAGLTHWDWADCIKILSWSFVTKHYLRYCGIYSQLTAYPAFTNVYVQVLGHASGRVLGEMYFSVLDNHRVRSVSCIHYKKSFELVSHSPSCLEFLANKHMFQLQTIHMKVNFTHRIWLSVKTSSPATKCQFFDGPGQKSEIQDIIKFNYLSSTFQAVLCCLYPWTEMNEMRFIYYPQLYLRNTHVLHVHTQKMFSLPSSELCRTTNFCVIHLKTKKEFSINFTLSAFKYVGDKNTHVCDYAGLVVSENNASNVHCVQTYIGEEYKENCSLGDKFVTFQMHNQKAFEYMYPSFSDHMTQFSTSSSLHLVYFHYKEYGNMELNVSATSTQCRGGIHNDIASNSANSTVPVVLDERTTRNNFVRSTFNLHWTTQCYVIMIRHDPKDGRRLLLQFFVRQNLIRGQSMTISASGMLKGDSFVETRQGPLDKNVKCHKETSDNDLGVASCVCRSNSEIRCHNHFDFGNFTQQFERTTFSFSHTLKTPTQTYPFHALKLGVEMQHGYGTWLNIVVKVHNDGSKETLPHGIFHISKQWEKSTFEPIILGDNLFLYLGLTSSEAIKRDVCVSCLFVRLRGKNLSHCLLHKCV